MSILADNIVTMIIEPTNLDLNVIKISIIRPRKTLIAKWRCWLAAAQFVIFNLMKNISGARRKMLGFLGLCNLFRWRKIVISFIHFSGPLSHSWKHTFTSLKHKHTQTYKHNVPNPELSLKKNRSQRSNFLCNVSLSFPCQFTTTTITITIIVMIEIESWNWEFFFLLGMHRREKSLRVS